MPSPSLASVSASPTSLDVLARAQVAASTEMEDYIKGHTSLDVKYFPLPGDGTIRVLCDVSLSPLPPRPVVPSSLVRDIIASVHDVAHPGGNATLRDLRRRFVWQGMSTSVKDFCRSCLPCQRSKITRHVKAPLAPLDMPSHRFQALHLDIVGPLPECEGFSYLLTIIDRYSRWLEAVPLSSITAEACARALLRHWIARFGTPATVVTDRGRQFVSQLWSELSLLLGVQLRQTTSYHPQSNGLIERQHRTLKDRLISRACSPGSSSSWMDNLPFVLLGIRTSVREDSGCSASDLLYGTPLRLPGDMLAPDLSAASPSPSDFARSLRTAMLDAVPMPVVHHGVVAPKPCPRLLTATHVFLRIDAVKRPLTPPYEGPFPVLERSPKTFRILRHGKPVTVSVDRLKPAVCPALAPSPASSPAPAVAPPPTRSYAAVAASPAAVTTRSGRVSRPVLRFRP